MEQEIIFADKPNQVVQTELGRRIRTLRRQRAWSQTAMATLCGIHVSHLSKIERGGANATLSTLLVVAKNLEISVSELFNGIS